MSNELNANCPYCGTPAVRIEREFRVRRGDRVLSVQLPSWECQSGCTDESRTTPFRFANQALAATERERIREAWRVAFGEDIPEPRRPGRKPVEKRSVPVHVMLRSRSAATCIVS
jgi:hypothetical protein